MLKRKPNLPNATSRRCSVCGIEKPLTADYYQIVPSFAKGFSFYCNDCNTEASKENPFTREEFNLILLMIRNP